MTKGEMEKLFQRSHPDIVTVDTPPPLWSYTRLLSRDGNTDSGIGVGSWRTVLSPVSVLAAVAVPGSAIDP